MTCSGGTRDYRRAGLRSPDKACHLKRLVLQECGLLGTVENATIPDDRSGSTQEALETVERSLRLMLCRHCAVEGCARCVPGSPGQSGGSAAIDADRESQDSQEGFRATNFEAKSWKTASSACPDARHGMALGSRLGLFTSEAIPNRVFLPDLTNTRCAMRWARRV